MASERRPKNAEANAPSSVHVTVTGQYATRLRLSVDGIPGREGPVDLAHHHAVTLRPEGDGAWRLDLTTTMAWGRPGQGRTEAEVSFTAHARVACDVDVDERTVADAIGHAIMPDVRYVLARTASANGSPPLPGFGGFGQLLAAGRAPRAAAN